MGLGLGDRFEEIEARKTIFFGQIKYRSLNCEEPDVRGDDRRVTSPVAGRLRCYLHR